MRSLGNGPPFSRVAATSLAASQAFLVSVGVVALAEIGDKTQLLVLVLSARYRRSFPIVLGILVGTLANHTLAAGFGAWLVEAIGEDVMHWIVAAAFFAMAAWTLVPDKLDDRPQAGSRFGVFGATVSAIFLLEMADKTQIATITLAARYGSVVPVILGTTVGMLLANVPAVFLGERVLARLPLQWIRRAAAAIFAVLGVAVLAAG
jgi:putative Ca2+/H+ antiporter (TMEM165/GDT1 family)